MKSHWRRALGIAPLLAAALIVCVSGSVWAANVVGVEIYSPTESSPVKWVRPGSTITVMTRVTVDGNGWVRVSACIGDRGQYVEHYMAAASKAFSISLEVPNGTAEGGNNVKVIAQTILPDGTAASTLSTSESNAVYLDGTPPVLTLGTRPTTPTTNPWPTWTWSGNEALSGLDYYIVTLDGELPFQTKGTSFTPSSDLAHGTHVLKVKAVDRAGNVGTEQSFAAVTISTAPPEAPAITTLAAGYNTSPIAIDWNDVTDESYAISYVLQYANNAGFSGATSKHCPTSDYRFDAAAEGEGEYWFRAKTISTVRKADPSDPNDYDETKESGWSAVVSTIHDATAPDAPAIAHLPTHAKATQVVFRWSSTGDVAGYNLSYIVGDGEEWTTARGITTQSKVVKGPNDKDLDDRVTVKGMVQAYDSLGNTSEWSEIASTTIDLAGPEVAITAPAGAKNTNLSTFTWTWTGDDGECGSGVRGYWVRLNDEAWFWTMQPVFTSWRLQRGENVLYVKGVDNLGNEGGETAAPPVTLVDVAIFDVMPAPGEHPINEASTIVFSVAGLYDKVEVLLSNKPIEDEDAWRVVTIFNTPELAKFYVLLDDAVIQPGPLTVTIKIGDVVRYCDYEVLDERSGFGFGRLRPW